MKELRRQEGRKKEKRKSKEKEKNEETFGCIGGSFAETGKKE